MKIFLFSVLLGAAWGIPAQRNPMENPGMFEGDMLGIDITRDRNAVPLDSQRWPKGVVPYVIDPSMNPFLTKLQAGMNHISQRTCIRFVKRTTERDYIKIFVGEGCYAHWGLIGGEQSLSLGTGCYDIGTVVHELLHALGFEHEHNRSDRDDHLIIYWNNIPEEWHYAFYKLTPQQNRLLTAFDFDSVMLYGQTAFAKEGTKSMVAKNGRFMEETYHKSGMSTGDITRVKMLYNC